jgi:Leucine-rich repeat (LRR) protein
MRLSVGFFFVYLAGSIFLVYLAFTASNRVPLGSQPTKTKTKTTTKAKTNSTTNFLKTNMSAMHDTLKALRAGELAGSKTLKLKGLGLTSFPTEILTLANTLELLDLGDNELTSLPSELLAANH